MPCLLTLAAVSALARGLPTATAWTRFGAVNGVVVDSGGAGLVEQFLNVPYALPPVNNLRFADTVGWSTRFAGGSFNATRLGVQCPQDDGSGGMVGDEDCLYLSVWAAAGRGAFGGGSPQPLPVLVWLHGGNFVSGNGDQYNATLLAAKHGVVVVAANYRLSHLGWLQPVRGLANFGLKDQRAALAWVHENIAAFGGDPTRVLLFGESAGAISVGAHLVSPGSDGLFSTALMESGYASGRSQKYALRLADTYSVAAGCGANATARRGGAAARLACLRAAPLAKLRTAAAATTALPPDALPFDEIGWGPTVDGARAGLPEDPAVAVAAGRVNGGNASLLAGTNANEATVFVFPAYPDGLSAANYTPLMRSMLSRQGRPPNATLLARVLARYPPNATAGADNCALAARAFADFSFTCRTRRLARALAAQGRGVRVFAYRFVQRAAADDSPAAWGVAHGSEVPFVFDQGSWVGDAGFTHAEEQLATSMGAAWSNFAARADPNAAHSAVWPDFAASEDEWVLEAGASRAQPYSDAAACDFWDQQPE
jgi:carboxylesterase type B